MKKHLAVFVWTQSRRDILWRLLCLMSRLPSSRPCYGDRRSHVCGPTLHFMSSLLSNKNNLIFETKNIKNLCLFHICLYCIYYIIYSFIFISCITLFLRLYWVEFLSVFYIMSDQNFYLTSRIYCIIHGWIVWKCKTTNSPNVYKMFYFSNKATSV